MDKIYVAMQVVVSLYTLQTLIGQGQSPMVVVSLIGLHLIIYLVGCLETRYRWLHGIDGIYLVVLGMMGTTSSVLLGAVLAVELWEKQDKAHGVVLLGGIVLMIACWREVINQWLVIVLITLVGYMVYVYKNHLKNLKAKQLLLLEKNDVLRRDLGHTTMSKNEIAYMTKLS